MKPKDWNEYSVEMAIAQVIKESRYVLQWTVEDWVIYGDVPQEFAHLPNAIAALTIIHSPLMKALKEE